MGKIGDALGLTDVLLDHLKDDPLFEITIPDKTQASMASGRPILMAGNGNAAALVERAGAGLECVPEDPKGIADTVGKLYNTSH